MGALYLVFEPMELSAVRRDTTKPRDVAKIGQLVLAHGLWQGRQIVPRAYIDEATAPQIQGAGAYFYGYQM
jgi:hypothetical protein